MESIIIIIAVMWLVRRVLRAVTGGTKNKTQQAVQEQKRRLEEYQRQQAANQDLPEHPWQMNSYDEEEDDDDYEDDYEEYAEDERWQQLPATAPLTAYQTQSNLRTVAPAVGMDSKTAPPEQAVTAVKPIISPEMVVQGVVWAEILGEPRARHKHIRRF